MPPRWRSPFRLAPRHRRRPIPTKLFATAAEVDAALAKAKAEHKGDDTNTVEVLVSVGPYPVQLEYRTGTTAPSLHKGQAELIYVVDGGCTLVTGGTLVGMHGTGTDGFGHQHRQAARRRRWPRAITSWCRPIHRTGTPRCRAIYAA